MAEKTNKTKILNLVVSVLATVILIVIWHFVIPQDGSNFNLLKYISYALLMFNAVWIADAALAFLNISGETEQERVAKRQMIYAMVGFIIFLLYGALAHPVVAVFFGDGTQRFLIDGFAKDGFAVIGFALLVEGSMHVEGEGLWSWICGRFWTLISGPAAFVLGLIISLFLNLDVTTGIMSGVVAILFFVDVFLTGKRLGISPIRFAIWEVVYVAIISLVLLVIRFIHIHLGTHLATFLVRAVVNLAFALVIEAGIVLACILVRKKNKKEQE